VPISGETFEFPITAITRSRAITAILTALSLHPSASAPTRHIRFVANKSESDIQPSDDRAVEGHHSSFSASLLHAFW
jgi:hypothetical protein